MVCVKAAAYKMPAVPDPTPYKPEPVEALGHAYGKIDRAKFAADEASRRASAARDVFVGRLNEVVGYFRKAAYDRLPFASVEAAARTYYGDTASTLMGMVYESARLKEKRAGDAPAVEARPIPRDDGPLALVKKAIDAATECAVLAAEKVAAREKAASVKTEEMRPFSKAGQSQPPTETGPWTKEAAAVFEKAAFGFGTEVAAIAAGDILAHKATHGSQEDDPYGDVSSLEAEIGSIRDQAKARRSMRKIAAEKSAFLNTPAAGAAIGTMLARTVGNVPKTKDDLVTDAWLDLEDPEHANELRKIRARAMLTNLMTDPDDPISGHDPETVMNAYNEISTATPRLAENAATLRPALRKRLEGRQEPFEVKEMLDTEKAIAQSRTPTPNTNIMGEGPSGLLG